MVTEEFDSRRYKYSIFQSGKPVNPAEYLRDLQAREFARQQAEA